MRLGHKLSEVRNLVKRESGERAVFVFEYVDRRIPHKRNFLHPLVGEALCEGAHGTDGHCVGDDADRLAFVLFGYTVNRRFNSRRKADNTFAARTNRPTDVVLPYSVFNGIFFDKLRKGTALPVAAEYLTDTRLDLDLKSESVRRRKCRFVCALKIA